MKGVLKYVLLLGVTLMVKPLLAQVDSVCWNFTDGTPNTVTNLTWANFSCTPFTTSSGGVPSITSSSVSNYAGASAGNNLGFACPSGGTYIEWVMEPDVAKEITLSYISFGVRSTGTGATTWALRSSKDAYVGNIAIGDITANSTWTVKNSTVNFSGGVGNVVTFRLYFYNASGGASINTRIDDVKLRVAKSTLEPKIRLSQRKLDFATAVGVPNDEIFTIQGLLLDQNISVVSTHPQFTVSKSSIDYTSANTSPQTVTVTFDGVSNATGKIVLKTNARGVDITDTVRLTGVTSSSADIEVTIPSTGKIEFPPIMVNALTTQMIEITGNSLTDSISVISPRNPAFTVSATKLRKNADRDYLFLYFRPTAEGVLHDTLVLSSRGVADVRLPIRAEAVTVRTDLLPPSSYYVNAKYKTGAALKTALYNTVKGHTIVPYSYAWTAYAWLDIRPECDMYMPDASVWDMYTDRPGCLPDNSLCVPNYTNPAGNPCSGFKVLRIGTDQTSSTNPGGSVEGMSYEREHTFPKGWWAAAKSGSGSYRETSPMYCDLFHLYPCDHRVNNLRNDNPYGEVHSPSTTFTNGSRLGPNTAGGTFTGTAYEPIDEYKGDIARNYFYMVTRYENTVQHWSKNIIWGGALYDSVVAIAPGLHTNASPMIDTNSYPVFKPWAHEMLVRWHRLDPVSEKEQQRNQTIYDRFQYNRNPFIDHPELVEYIWGDSVGRPWPGGAALGFTADVNSVVVIDGAFAASVYLANAEDGVRKVTCYLGTAVGDTSLAEYAMSGSGNVYTTTFTPDFSYTTLVLTFIAYDNAGHRAVVSYTYVKPTRLSLALDTVICVDGEFDVSVKPQNAQRGVKSVILYVGLSAQDTTLDSYHMLLNGDVYRVVFYPLYSYPTLYFTFVAYDNAGNRAELRYTYGEATGISKDGRNELLFQVYPNPACNDEVYVQLEEEATKVSVELFDSNGLLVKVRKMNSVASRIDLQGLPEGIYFLRVITDKGSGVRKFIIAQ